MHRCHAVEHSDWLFQDLEQGGQLVEFTVAHGETRRSRLTLASLSNPNRVL